MYWMADVDAMLPYELYDWMICKKIIFTIWKTYFFLHSIIKNNDKWKYKYNVMIFAWAPNEHLYLHLENMVYSRGISVSSALFMMVCCDTSGDFDISLGHTVI